MATRAAAPTWAGLLGVLLIGVVGCASPRVGGDTGPGASASVTADLGAPLPTPATGVVPGPDATGSVATGPVGAEARGAAQATAALNRLFAQRSTAVRDGDRSAWAATVADPGGAAGRAEFAAYEALLALGVRDLSGVVVGSAPTPVAEPTPDHTIGQADAGPIPARWTATVRLGYSVPGVDRGPREVDRRVTLVRSEGQWRIERWLQPGDRWEVFDLLGLQVARTERTVVAGAVPVQTLLDRLAEAESGQDRVASVWGSVVPALLVVTDTPEQAAHLLGTPAPAESPAPVPVRSTPPLAGRPSAALAATTHGARAPRAPALADRVILDPQGMARLTPTGRRVVLTHELTHVTVRGSTAHDLPMWLSEGFAEWVAFGDTGLSEAVVAQRLLDRVRGAGPPADLPAAVEFAGLAGDPAAAYQGAWLAVSWLADRSGPAGLVATVRAMAGDPSSEPVTDPPTVEAALRRATGLGQADLVEGWRSRLLSLARG